MAVRNDVGLLAEEYVPSVQRQVGNFPQAFSHLALVGTAMSLHETGPVQQRGQRSKSR
jgi:GH15 family glucan-1,4-alpha-glucosidase